MDSLSWRLVRVVLAAMLAGGSLGLAAAEADAGSWKVLQDWRFDEPGALRAWRPNADLAEVSVSQAGLACRAVGSDPILEFTGLLDLPASPWQALEVVLWADAPGTAEWFWSPTNQGRFGGFSQELTHRFPVTGDGQWHTNRVMPFWQKEGKIARLRFDLYDGAKFVIRAIRLLELSAPAAPRPAEFDFSRGTEGWQPVDGLVARDSQAGPAAWVLREREGRLLSPPVRLEAEAHAYLSLRLAVDRGRQATFSFATRAARGLESLSFKVIPDGREHTYNVDLLAAPGWSGEVVALALQPSEEPGAEAKLSWLRIGDEPQGPPELAVMSFGAEQALPRAERRVVLAARVTNRGGQCVSNLQARLEPPSGIDWTSTVSGSNRLAALPYGDTALFQWQVVSARPQVAAVKLALTADNAAALETSARIEFTAPIALPSTGVVPEPRPVRSPYEVGVYYFPGWKSAEAWERLEPFPERRPVLGWYREGDPEVADWQIKWAVEHGITYFAYDWYWSQGHRQLEHGLDAFFKSRYHALLKFCLLWANHNPPHTSSQADCLAVTRFWIEHYFRRPEHLQIEGKPVMIIFSPHRLTEDLGSAQVKETFEAMRAECRQAGLKGLYLIACIGDVGHARQAAVEGYDAVSAYNWPGLGMVGTGYYAPFETLLPAYQRHWEKILEQTRIPLLLPVSGGWDSRPWHGDNNVVRFGRTPELFKRHLQDAKRLLDQSNATNLLPRQVLIEAWNEWGEGSYIEPHQEFGFGYLDAIREVFAAGSAPHLDVTPADAHLGPYDVVRSTNAGRTAWDFSQPDQAWSQTMGLTELRPVPGGLAAKSISGDPAFFGPAMKVPASRWGRLRVKLRLQREGGAAFTDQAQLFWRISRRQESEATSARFAVLGDGQWHEYTISLRQQPNWRGTVDRLRLDPCNQAGVQIEIGSVRLEP